MFPKCSYCYTAPANEAIQARVQSLSLAGSIRGTAKLVPRQSWEWLQDRDLVSAVTIEP